MSTQFNVRVADSDVVQTLMHELNLPHFMAATLAARGIESIEEVQRFLSPSLDRDWLNPYTIPGLQDVADALEAAIKEDKRIDELVREVRRMRTSKGIFESYDHFDKRVAELKAEKAALRKKYRYMARENDKKIEAITAKQEAERDMQKKLLKRYEDFLKLINFVKYIEEDSFWRAEIVQIVASTMSSGDVRLELIPRTGRHIVQFGTLDDAEAKLDKLLAFYEKGLKNIGWGVYRTISVEYKGQVVCTK